MRACSVVLVGVVVVFVVVVGVTVEGGMLSVLSA